MKNWIKIITVTFVAIMMPMWANAADDVAAQIQAQNAKYEAAYNAGDADAVMKLHTKDTRVWVSGQPAWVGSEAVRAAIAAETSGSAKHTLKIETTDLEITEEMAYEKGRSTLLIETPDQESLTVSGPYLVVWKKVGQEWLIHLDVIFGPPL